MRLAFSFTLGAVIFVFGGAGFASAQSANSSGGFEYYGLNYEYSDLANALAGNGYSEIEAATIIASLLPVLLPLNGADSAVPVFNRSTINNPIYSSESASGHNPLYGHD